MKALKKKPSRMDSNGRKKVPNNRPPSDEGIFEIDLQKGNFDQKLEEFLQGINDHRNKINL